MKRQRKQKRSLRKPVLMAGIGLLVIGGVIAILELTNNIHLFHDAPRPVTASADTKGEPLPDSTQTAVPPQNTTEQTGGGTNEKIPGEGGTSASSGAAPIDPTNSNFVNNHHPSLSKSATMASSCTTTPGATCVISFTNGSTAPKSLAAQTTDRGGSAYWDWKLQDIGLTPGSWRITATATLNGQSKTATDAINLEVTP